MDDRRLEKIKKTLGLAHSDELNERASAIRQACAFMRRDNITLEDLLHYLGKDNYFFTPVVDLARALADGEHPPGDARRSRFEALMTQINNHYFLDVFGNPNGQQSRQWSGAGNKAKQEQDDAEEAQRRADEAERARRNQQRQGQSQQSNQNRQQQSQQEQQSSQKRSKDESFSAFFSDIWRSKNKDTEKSPQPPAVPLADRIHAFFDSVDSVVERTKRVLDTLADFSLWGLAKGLFFAWLIYILLVPPFMRFLFGDNQQSQPQAAPATEAVASPAPEEAPAEPPPVPPEQQEVNALPTPVSFREISVDESRAIFDAFINAMTFSSDSPMSLDTLSSLFSRDVAIGRAYVDKRSVMSLFAVIGQDYYQACRMDLVDGVSISDVDSMNGRTINVTARYNCITRDASRTSDRDQTFPLTVRLDLRDGEPKITNLSGYWNR